MSNDKTSRSENPQTKNGNDQADARIGYQVAVDLWGILVESSWSRFNAMMVANSIIIAVLGSILTDHNHEMILLIFAIFLSIIGIYLTIFWFSLMARDSKFQQFYAESARHYEHSLSSIKTVLDGAKLANGHPVKRPDGPNKWNKEKDPQKNCLNYRKSTIASRIIYFLARAKYTDVSVKRVEEKDLYMQGLECWRTRDNINNVIGLFAGTYILIFLLAIILSIRLCLDP